MEDKRRYLTVGVIASIAIVAVAIVASMAVSAKPTATHNATEVVEAYACGYYVIINGTEVTVKYDNDVQPYARLRITFNGTHTTLGCEID